MTKRKVSKVLFVAVCMVSMVLATVAQSTSDVNASPVSPPRYVIDLDAAPETRWTALVQDLYDQHGWEHTLGPIVKYFDTIVPKEAQGVVDFVLAHLDDLLGEYGQEIRGLAALAEKLGYGKQLPLGKIVGMNIVYELKAACTSIVAADDQGNIFHGRNLDWDFLDFHNITVQVDFQRNNKTVYSGVTFAGYVGLLTGIRSDGFSITLDQRSTKNGTVWDNVKEAFFKKGKLAAMEIRESLSQDDTFDVSLHRMSTVHLINPSYLIMAGTMNEGAIVTRERDAPVDVWTLQDANRWYLVETNYDHWKAPPSRDDRRDPAIHAMDTMTQGNLTAPQLLTVMGTPPVKNKGTVYTVIMQPSTGELQTLLWV